MLKTIVIITSLTVAPVNTGEKVQVDPIAPTVETLTISKSLAEQLVQTIHAQHSQIAELKHEIYKYQHALYEARTKMCA